MTTRLAELVASARDLPPEERAQLVELLIVSLSESPVAKIRAAWDKEIAERLSAHEDGVTKTFDAEAVLAEARRIAR